MAYPKINMSQISESVLMITASWMLEVCTKLKLSLKVYLRSIEILYRILSARTSVKRIKMQLYAVVSIMISSCIHSYEIITCDEFKVLCANIYSADKIGKTVLLEAARFGFRVLEPTAFEVLKLPDTEFTNIDISYIVSLSMVYSYNILPTANKVEFLKFLMNDETPSPETSECIERILFDFNKTFNDVKEFKNGEC